MADDNDPWQDPGWLEYAAHAREELHPMIEGAAIGMAFVDGEIEPRMACELGYLVLLDKPILVVIEAGMKVPNKLVRIADEIVEAGAMDDPKFQKRMLAAMKRMHAKVAKESG